jgi:hypothetical protein
MIAYAGPAFLDRTPTGLWLATRLASVREPESPFAELAAALTRAVRGYPPWLRAVSVVAAGWQGRPDRLRPVHVALANFDAATGSVFGGFRTDAIELERDRKARVFNAGAALAPTRMADLESHIRRRAGPFENPGEFVAHLLAAARAAAPGNLTVGRNLLVGSLPCVQRQMGLSPLSPRVHLADEFPDWRKPEYLFAAGGRAPFRAWTPYVVETGTAGAAMP